MLLIYFKQQEGDHELYAQTSGTHTTNSATFVPIPGLTITNPEGVGTMALIILNVPNPFAKGTEGPGGQFGITVNGVISPVQAIFTYNEKAPVSFGRVPTTLVAGVPLITANQTITAVWFAVRNSTVVIDTPATLSAILQ